MIYKTPSAVILILTREKNGKKQALLQRRRNTGFADGLFDFSCAGKVEDGESMKKSAVREAAEELGVGISADDLVFEVFVHKRDRAFDLVYCNVYFSCSQFVGTPSIREPEKCSQLKWYDLDDLPDDLIDDRRLALNAAVNGTRYVEYGWE